MPLLSLLSEYLRFLVEWPLWQSFVSLYEVQSTNTASVPAHCLEIIPSLLADPIALMIKYTLLAPLRMDIGKHSLSTVIFRKPNTTNTEMKISVFPLFFFSLLHLHRKSYVQLVVLPSHRETLLISN